MWGFLHTCKCLMWLFGGTNNTGSSAFQHKSCFRAPKLIFLLSTWPWISVPNLRRLYQCWNFIQFKCRVSFMVLHLNSVLFPVASCQLAWIYLDSEYANKIQRWIKGSWKASMEQNPILWWMIQHLSIGNYHTGPGIPLQGHCKDQASIALWECLPLSPLFALHFPQGLKKPRLNSY